MAEKEYIEREAALSGYQTVCNGVECSRCPIRDYGHCKFEEHLRSIPAADVRSVVLCRDCENSYEWANVDGDNDRYCGYLRRIWNHDTDRMVYDDDYCKWGRKREES